MGAAAAYFAASTTAVQLAAAALPATAAPSIGGPPAAGIPVAATSDNPTTAVQHAAAALPATAAPSLGGPPAAGVPVAPSLDNPPTAGQHAAAALPATAAPSLGGPPAAGVPVAAAAALNNPPTAVQHGATARPAAAAPSLSGPPAAGAPVAASLNNPPTAVQLGATALPAAAAPSLNRTPAPGVPVAAAAAAVAMPNQAPTVQQAAPMALPVSLPSGDTGAARPEYVNPLAAAFGLGVVDPRLAPAAAPVAAPVADGEGARRPAGVGRYSLLTQLEKQAELNRVCSLAEAAGQSAARARGLSELEVSNAGAAKAIAASKAFLATMDRAGAPGRSSVQPARAPVDRGAQLAGAGAAAPAHGGSALEAARAEAAASAAGRSKVPNYPGWSRKALDKEVKRLGFGGKTGLRFGPGEDDILRSLSTATVTQIGHAFNARAFWRESDNAEPEWVDAPLGATPPPKKKKATPAPGGPRPPTSRSSMSVRMLCAMQCPVLFQQFGSSRNEASRGETDAGATGYNHVFYHGLARMMMTKNWVDANGSPLSFPDDHQDASAPEDLKALLVGYDFDSCVDSIIASVPLDEDGRPITTELRKKMFGLLKDIKKDHTVCILGVVARF